MRRSTRSIIFFLVVTLKSFRIVSCDSDTDTTLTNSSLTQTSFDSSSCNDLECVIRANLTLLTGVQLPVKIDCSALNETDTGQPDLPYSSQLNDLFLNRFKNIRNVSIDGRCSNAATFGLQHFPDTNSSVEAAVFHNFQIDAITRDLFRNVGAIKELIFENNTFRNVEHGAFEYVPLVAAIIFKQNQLRRIEAGVFENLQNLKVLDLQESSLIIENDAFFENVNCEKLSINVRSLKVETFEKLSEQLQELQVNNMSFSELAIYNPGTLTTLAISNNNITRLTVIDNSKSTLKQLNLSGNSIESLHLVKCSNVESLDLSNNSLVDLQSENFIGMNQLKVVYLQNNKLETLSMDIFQPCVPGLLKIDLTNNLLRSINIRSDMSPNPDLKVVINKNPLDCRWILEMFNQRPDLFRIFQYEKFVSRINVNGLQCITYPSASYVSGQGSVVVAASENPADVEFSQAEDDADEKLERTLRRHILYGLLISIALAGVAAIVFYIWVKCRRMFGGSFYTSLKQSNWTPERFDVIRPLPRDNSPGYEIPLQFLDTNVNMEHVELLDTIGNLEPIEMSMDDIPEPVALYEEIKDIS